MIKPLLIVAFCIVLWGCGSASDNKSDQAQAAGKNPDRAAAPAKPLGSYEDELAELERLQAELKENKETYLADQAEADSLIEQANKLVADKVREKTFSREDGRMVEETIASHQEFTKQNKRNYRGRARQLEREIKQQQRRVEQAKSASPAASP